MKGPQVLPPDDLEAYVRALRALGSKQIRTILETLGAEPGISSSLTDLLEFLEEPGRLQRVLEALETGPRVALGLFSLSERTHWSLPRLNRLLSALGLDAQAALEPLLGRGLLVFEPGLARQESGPAVSGSEEVTIRAHPQAVSLARTTLPTGSAPAPVPTVRFARAADGLEPILRLAAVWQRLAETPLRRTQHGTLFKRDQDRLEADPALTGPIADSCTPLPGPLAFWLDLAREVGLVVPEPEGDRLVAAPASFWSDHAVHLPRMIALRWLVPNQPGLGEPGFELPLAALLWLAVVPDPGWVAIPQLVEQIEGGFDTVAKGSKPKERSRAVFDRLESLLLGIGYPLGLIEVAEEDPGGQRLVRLTPLGRYTLALGPPPPPRPVFEPFLVVQPSFALIAFRQGLNPWLIGKLSCFARWERLDAAVELKLTAEDTYRGLEGGLGPDAILEFLQNKSGRPVPAAVAEAIRTWAGRRERITFSPAATLIEFASPEDQTRALTGWPAEAAQPVVVTDRILLVEDAPGIPFQRFRILGARDYRQPPEACVTVDPNGVTLSIDPGRSDLFVAAELARLAEEVPPPPGRSPLPRRQFLITAASLKRACDQGLDETQLEAWFQNRTGEPLPAAVRLLLQAMQPEASAPRLQRQLVLHVASPKLLDGLLQHPQTSPFLGERLGPTAVVVPDALWPSLETALRSLGLPPA